jgi:pSer/pThr/pTyr-binding forkhead associated (FHA) protein
MSAPIVLVLRLMVAITLYGFLGLALWTMWLEIRRDAERAVRQKIPQIRLQLSAPGKPPVVRAFSQPEILLGRDPLADVPLSDEAVSARHALLSHHHGQWWLEDLGSTNGTRLNRESLSGPTVLATDDEISCGQARLSVSLQSEDDEPMSPETGGHHV